MCPIEIYVWQGKTDWTRCNIEPKNRQNTGKKGQKRQ
jgi:hypothetical protein